ncbi:MAG: hypothetical protein HY293_10790, partial [Planctomycetes bacterium]|nr:hypothetical protein [Planctomycetota bacterium]
AARVRTWGLDALSAQLDALLAATTVPAPPAPELSAEAKAWQTRKEPAWARAAARDFAGAAADLERAAAALTEEALRKECADDVRDLKEFDRLYPAAISAAGSSKSLALRTVDDQSVSGRVLTADADRVELLVDPVKPTVFLEWSDVRASSLLPFLKELNPDARILQLLERLDGLARPKPAEDELRAREIYYEAERQFRTMATREKSLEGYRLLKQKHKDSALVRRAAARIDRRLDSGKDYYFVGADLAWGGSFSLTKEGRLESIAESDPAQANRNFVEAEYFPLPGAAYRCWVLAGGCCAEAFSFHYQASGLTELNPKTKKRAPAEPGSDLASPVKHSIRNLKPSHPKNEAKKPLRWEWVEVTLPRASGPGTRRIRFLTDQQGFGVAALLLSSTRSHPPAEAELGDLAKARALDATPAWALSRPGSVPRILLDDFEGGIAGWGYHGGNEFPGAKGSQAYDPAVGHEGKGSLRLAGDFTGGGAYVSTGRPLPPGRDVKEVRFWLKSDRAVMLGIRIGDSTDQCHQHPVQLASTKDWQEVVLTFEKLAGKEHWGGANDGKWHGPAKSFYLCVSTTTFAGSKAGEIWIDDVEAILNVESDR